MKARFQKINKKLRHFFLSAAPTVKPFMKKPLFWCICACALLCILVPALVILGHSREAGANPLTALNNGRSFVLEGNLSDLYAAADLDTLPDDTYVAPEVVKVDATDTPDASATEDASSVLASSDTDSSGSLAPDSDSSAASSIYSPGSGSSLYTYDNTGSSDTGETDAGSTDAEAPQTENTSSEAEAPVTAEPDTSIPPQIVLNGLATEVNQALIALSITAYDYSNTLLQSDALSVVCNEETVTARYTTDSYIIYSLNLVEGENKITVTATDANGLTNTVEQTVVYTIPETPVITICIEATTVGFGYLIAPTTVALEIDSETNMSSQNLAYYVTQLLTESGYTLQHTGTVNRKFSLTFIEKEGAFQNPQIPEDLKSLILASETFAASFDETNYDENKLGVDQFVTGGSKWMFSVNDEYDDAQNMSAIIPEANDVIRIRYTLIQGKDIGYLTEEERNATESPDASETPAEDTATETPEW